MARRLYALLALAPVVLACGSSAGNLMCPTSSQKLTFTTTGGCCEVAGGCNGGTGTEPITLTTQPGLCTFTVTGGPAAGLPSQGQFYGTASETGYDLGKGNWYLFTDEGGEDEGSTEVNCEISIAAGTGVISLTCDGTICQPDDCGGGGSCADSSCIETMTPTM
jgi:hypothetical protein